MLLFDQGHMPDVVSELLFRFLACLRYFYGCRQGILHAVGQIGTNPGKRMDMNDKKHWHPLLAGFFLLFALATLKADESDWYLGLGI